MRFLTSLILLIVSTTSIFAQIQLHSGVYIYGHSPDWNKNMMVTTIGIHNYEFQIALWNVNNGKMKIVGDGSDARFSPDGSMIVFRSLETGIFKLASVEKEAVVDSFVIPDSRGQFSWISNHEILFVRPIYIGPGESYKSIWKYDLISRVLSQVWSFDNINAIDDIEAFDDSPNNWFITGTADKLTGQRNTGLWASTGSWLLDGTTGFIQTPRFKQIDGQIFVLYRKRPSWGDNGVYLLNFSDQSSQRISWGISACWSSDGKWMAIAGNGNDRIQFLRTPIPGM